MLALLADVLSLVLLVLLVLLASLVLRCCRVAGWRGGDDAERKRSRSGCEGDARATPPVIRRGARVNVKKRSILGLRLSKVLGTTISGLCDMYIAVVSSTTLLWVQFSSANEWNIRAEAAQIRLEAPSARSGLPVRADTSTVHRKCRR